MLFFTQANGPAMVPLLANVRPTEIGMNQGPSDCSCTKPITVKLEGIPGGQGTSQLNSDVNDQNLNMENEKEGLTVSDGSP